MARSVIAIRSNQYTDNEQKLYNQLLNYFSPDDIFFIFDECKNKVNSPSLYNKLSWDLEFLEQESLLNYNHFNRGIGWLCGDYFYYTFRKYVFADYYWLIEPDVLLSFDNLSDFFECFETIDCDGIFCNTYTLPNNDYWYKSAHLINPDNPRACTFPLNRLSGKAIDICKEERIKISKMYKESNSFSFSNNSLGIHFPNDECLVFNTLNREKLSVRDFRDFFPHSFDYFSFHHYFSIPQDDLVYFRNQVIHPIRSINKIEESLSSNIIDLIDRNNLLDLHHITEDNISILSHKVGANIAKYFESYLKSKIKLRITLDKVKSEMIKCLPTHLKPKKIWFYGKDTVVFDFEIDGKIITFDFIYREGKIICEIFDRKNVNSDYIRSLSNKLQIEINNNGRVYFELKLEDFNSMLSNVICYL